MQRNSDYSRNFFLFNVNMIVRKVKESKKGLEANSAVTTVRLVAPILETSLSYYVFMFNNFYPASAWWIRASDGAMEPVTKHDLWLKNPKNLKKWGLEALNTHLERLTSS